MTAPDVVIVCLAREDARFLIRILTARHLQAKQLVGQNQYYHARIADQTQHLIDQLTDALLGTPNKESDA